MNSRDKASVWELFDGKYMTASEVASELELDVEDVRDELFRRWRLLSGGKETKKEEECGS